MNTEPRKTEVRRARSGVPLRALGVVTRNWMWKLLALFLAICLWAGLISQDPTLTRERIFADVPLTVNNADLLRRNSGLVVVSGLEDENLQVRLLVDVPQREYSTVTYSNYNPRVDLTRISDVGEQTLKISTTSTSTYGSVVDVEPDAITVMVDEYVTNYRVPVSVNISGDYPEGFYGDAISLDPSVVALSGPKSIVDQVKRIYVDFDVSRLSAHAGTIRTALPMRFVDQNGKDVESDMLEVTSADVVLRTIILEQTLYPIRLLPVSGESLISGEPAEGYRIKSVSVSPQTLRVAGDAEVLETLDALFASAAVDVSDKAETFTQTARLRKPTELEYLSSSAVDVTVEIEPVTISRTFDSVKLQVLGTGSGLKASLDQKYTSLVLTGPQLVLEGLRPSKVSAYVDATGLEAGEHVLPVMLRAEETDLAGVTHLATPATVTVTLAED